MQGTSVARQVSSSVVAAQSAFGPEEHSRLQRTACDLFCEQAERTPQDCALRDGSRAWTYAELRERVCRLAGYLRSRGVTRETPVGILLRRSNDMVAATLGVMLSGGSYVPMDPDYPPEHLRYIWKDAGIRLVITEEALLGELLGDGTEAICVDRDAAAIAAAPPVSRQDGPRPTDRAYVLYTSGSTGRPKGAQIEHRSLTNLLLSVHRLTGMGPTDTYLATASICFDIAAAELHLALLVGGTTWVADRNELKDGERFAALLERSSATYAQSTASGWKMLLKLGWKSRSNLTICTGGEPLSRELAEQLLSRGKRVWNWYGPTETTIYSTGWLVDLHSEAMLIGKPIDNTELKVADESGQPVPAGEVGELWIGGVGVARGYLNRPELNQEKFVQGWYRTGDRVRMHADGNLEYLGRVDHQVKIRGYRIEPGEIENTLRQHPAVSEAVVIKDEDANQDSRLICYVVPAEVVGRAESTDWQGLFNEAYLHEGGGRQAVIESRDNPFAGYRSSYTGQLVPEAEMREWADTTLQRLFALSPRRVLEIGSGLGLLALPLSKRCEQYTGLDFSQSAVDHLQARFEKEGLSNARVLQREANQLSGLGSHEYDLVILNSVVQYFPDAEYFLSVIRQALDLLAPGGVLFMGDIRNAHLQEVFHADILRHRAAKPFSQEELARRLEVALLNEKELVISPEFFHALAGTFPQVDRVRVELREGRSENEFTRFRYDAFLQVQSQPAFLAQQPVRDWATQPVDMAALEKLAKESSEPAFLVRGIPNARLPQEAQGQPGLHPEAVRELAARHGWRVAICWSVGDAPGGFDAQFYREKAGQVPSSFRPDRYGTLGAPEQYCRFPKRALSTGKLPSMLREWVGARLPAHMVPSHFIVLDTLPLTPNGKLDRKALPPPEAVRPEMAEPYVAPRNDVERKIVQMLEAQLSLRPVGVGDNYFELGGNSLSAITLIKEVQDTFGCTFPLMGFFEAPTAATLALLVSARADIVPAGASASALVPIQKAGNGSPFFCVHGAGGVAFALVDFAQQVGKERPVYAIQDPAITDLSKTQADVRDMAASYVQAIRTVQPEGPYYLGGYCFGGMVAFEMAQQLRAASQKVELLALLDAPFANDRWSGHSPLRLMYRKIRSFIEIWGGFAPYAMDDMFVRLASRRAERAKRGEKASGFSDWMERRLLAFAKRNSVLGQILDEQSPLLSTRQPEMENLKKLVRHHVAVWERYQAQPYDGRVLFVRSTVPTMLTDNYGDDILGWRSYLKGEVVTRDVPGANHFSLPRRPFALTMAEHVKEALRGR
ncbi:amino acid adenylation domain-containing protein [Hyalangium minutum]|uniref:Long-chain-fatty-acid--CoA ligase n=1 Tax=Hyalangium minutum TaxID=394096 RepID=A0A085WVY8_9BACT|nr:amino acid adenylation domain-containing protein [Hyalangium minutum]KFE71851.1 Long-chain-fatty-acid--CoA ligase [Hyalangium minutum]